MYLINSHVIESLSAFLFFSSFNSFALLTSLYSGGMMLISSSLSLSLIILIDHLINLPCFASSFLSLFSISSKYIFYLFMISSFSAFSRVASYVIQSRLIFFSIRFNALISLIVCVACCSLVYCNLLLSLPFSYPYTPSSLFFSSLVFRLRFPLESL